MEVWTATVLRIGKVDNVDTNVRHRGWVSVVKCAFCATNIVLIKGTKYLSSSSRLYRLWWPGFICSWYPGGGGEGVPWSERKAVYSLCLILRLRMRRALLRILRVYGCVGNEAWELYSDCWESGEKSLLSEISIILNCNKGEMVLVLLNVWHLLIVGKDGMLLGVQCLSIRFNYIEGIPWPAEVLSAYEAFRFTALVKSTK